MRWDRKWQTDTNTQDQWTQTKIITERKWMQMEKEIIKEILEIILGWWKTMTGKEVRRNENNENNNDAAIKSVKKPGDLKKLRWDRKWKKIIMELTKFVN